MPNIQQTAQQEDISKEVVLACLQRILKSKVFAHSASLRDTLAYIVRNSLSSSPEHLKEYSIATEVLGRTGDFNPKEDNIVRVQMHRLREKLEEFYSVDGKDEPIRIVIPRGQYTPEYVRTAAEGQTAAAAPVQPPAASEARRMRLDWRVWVIIGLIGCNLAFVVNHFRSSTRRLPSAFSFMWPPFLLPGSPPLIVYSNAAFLVSTRENFYFYDPPTVLSMPTGSRVSTLGSQNRQAGRGEESGPFYFFDTYTGSGELVAAARIAQFLTSYGRPYLIKRSRIASYEDVKNQNVIFLGGTGQNLILRNLPVPQELVFVPAPPDQIPMGSYIRDPNPPPGHPAEYRLQLDPSSGAVQVEYALISLLPNISAGHDVMILAGITTLGGQAAADYVTSEPSMAVLQQMRDAANGQKSHFLQALLEVRVRDGVPLDAKCLLVRNLSQSMR